MSRYFFISFLLLYSLTSVGQGLGIDISAPVSMLHVYENTANTGIVAGVTVEQDAKEAYHLAHHPHPHAGRHTEPATPRVVVTRGAAGGW